MTGNTQSGWRRWLPKSRSMRSIAQLAGGTVAGQVIVVLITPILTRLFTPAEFGVLAVFISMVGIVGALASLRYELAIPIAEDDEKCINLVALCLGVIVAVAATTGLVVSFGGDWIATELELGADQAYLWFVPVGVVLVGAYQVFSYWNVRDHDYAAIARTKLWQGGGMASTQLSTGVLGAGAGGLIVGELVGRSMGTAQLARRAWRRHREDMHALSFAAVVRQARRFQRFPLLTGTATVFNNVGLRLPALLFAGMFGPEVAGWFALSQRIIGVPMSLVGQAVAKVYLGSVSELRRDRPDRMLRLYMRMSGGLAVAGLLPSLLLIVAAPKLFAFGFGESWEMAGLYTRYLALMLAVQFVAGPLSQTLNVLERQDLQLFWDVLRAVLVVAVFFAGQQLTLSALTVVGLYSAGLGLTYAVLWFMARHVLQNESELTSTAPGTT